MELRWSSDSPQAGSAGFGCPAGFAGPGGSAGFGCPAAFFASSFSASADSDVVADVAGDGFADPGGSAGFAEGL